MTNEEILEAQKVIAGMKNDLAVIAGTANVEKLISLVLEKGPRMMDSFLQLVRHRPPIFESVSDCDSVQIGLAAMMAVAELAKRHPDKKPKLIAAVTMLRLGSTLDKTAQALREMRQ